MRVLRLAALGLLLCGTALANPPAVAIPTPLPTQDSGTLPSGVSQPAGGAGLTGLLGGIYAKLLGSLAVTGVFWQATQPVSGTVADSNSAPYLGAVALTSGVADSAYRRTIGFTCTGSGTLILATSDGTTSTIDIIGSAAMQYAPWSVNEITVGTATGCTRLLNIK